MFELARVPNELLYEVLLKTSVGPLCLLRIASPPVDALVEKKKKVFASRPNFGFGIDISPMKENTKLLQITSCTADVDGKIPKLIDEGLEANLSGIAIETIRLKTRKMSKVLQILKRHPGLQRSCEVISFPMWANALEKINEIVDFLATKKKIDVYGHGNDVLEFLTAMDKMDAAKVRTFAICPCDGTYPEDFGLFNLVKKFSYVEFRKFRSVDLHNLLWDIHGSQNTDNAKRIICHLHYDVNSNCGYPLADPNHSPPPMKMLFSASWIPRPSEHIPHQISEIVLPKKSVIIVEKCADSENERMTSDTEVFMYFVDRFSPEIPDIITDALGAERFTEEQKANYLRANGQVQYKMIRATYHLMAANLRRREGRSQTKRLGSVARKDKRMRL